MKLSNKLLIVLAVLLISALFVGNAFAMSGSGTSSDPYIVTTAQDLQDMSLNPSAYYELGNDISLSGVTWTSFAFSGHLDGKNKVISGLTHTDALFTSFTGEMKDVTFSEFEITSTSDNSGIVTDLITGTNTMSNIVVTDSSISSTGNNVGGFVGKNDGIFSGVTVKDSSVIGSGTYVGGLIGYQNNDISNCDVLNCYIENTNSSGYTGGLVGMMFTKIAGNNSQAYIQNCNVCSCYVKGNIVGGIGGFKYNRADNGDAGNTAMYTTMNIQNCNVSNNIIKSNAKSGGILGDGRYVTNSWGTIGYHYNLNLQNVNIANNNIYSVSGTANGICERIGFERFGRYSWGLDGILTLSNTKIENNIIYSETSDAYYVGAKEWTTLGSTTNSVISDCNVYGVTVYKNENYITEGDNIVNTQGLYYTSNPTMNAEQVSIYGLVHIDLIKGMGTALNVDTVNHIANSGITFNNGITTVNDYPSTIYENNYDSGTYTATASFKFINPSDLSTSTSKSTTKQFTVVSSKPEGSGTQSDPYRLVSAGNLQWIENDLDAYYILMNDIDLSDFTWTQIDNFAGHLNGNHKTISGLTTTNADGGLFRHAINAEIYDLTLDNFDVTTTDLSTTTGWSGAGILVGYVNGGSYTGITVQNSKLEGTPRYVGGIIGVIDGTNAITIEYNKLIGCDIHGSSTLVTDRRLGGILGGTYWALNTPSLYLNNCEVSDSKIHGKYMYCGGIIGVGTESAKGNANYLQYNTVKDSIFEAEVMTTNSYMGGIVGMGADGNTCYSEGNLVENCILKCSTGDNSAMGTVGGIVGCGCNVNVNDRFESTDDSVIRCSFYAPTWSQNQDVHCTGGIAGRPYEYGYRKYIQRHFVATNVTVSECTFVCPHTALVCGESNADGTSGYQSVTINGGNFVNNNIMGTYANNGLTQRTDFVTINNNPVIEGTTTIANSYLSINSLTPSVSGYTVSVDSDVRGSSVSYDSVNGVIVKDNLEYDFGDSSSELITDELSVEHTYSARGTYTTTLTATNYFLSQAISLESESYSVPNEVLPTIEDVETSNPEIIQTGDVDVTLSATITAPTGHTVDSIQWQYSVDNTTFIDIENATTDTYTWRVPVGDYYVKVLASIGDSTAESDVITQTAYGLPTITSATINGKSDLNVYALRGSDAVLNATYTPSSNPVPDTYSQWKVSLDNGSTWIDLLSKNVNSGTYTLSTAGNFKVKYIVGDDDSENFVSSSIFNVSVVNSEVIVVVADKTDAGVGETITLTATVTNPQPDDSYKWQSSPDNDVFTDISGETGLVYDFVTSNVGTMYYRFVSTNSYETYHSSVITIKTYGAPTVSADVTPLTVSVDSEITLTGNVTVNPTMGDSDYSVQWKYSDDDGVTWTNVVGGNVLNTVTSFDSYGDYQIKLVVTDDYYTVNSEVFDVEVISVPTIESVSVSPTTAKETDIIYLNSTVTSDTPSFSVQWKYKSSTSTEWSNVTGGNVQNCTISDLSAGNYNIKLIATNEYGSTESTVFNVEVVAQPSVTASVDKQSVTVGDTIVFTFSVTDESSYEGECSLEVNYGGGVWNLLASDITSPYSHEIEVSNECIYRIAYINELYVVYSNEMTVTGHDVPVISTITLDVSDGEIGFGDSITASTTVTSDLNISSYWWYANASTPQTKIQAQDSENVTTYTYEDLPVGEYIVGIYVIDELDNEVTGVCNTHVKVYGQPTVSVNINPSTVNVDETITLTSEVTPNATMGDNSYTVQWKYSDDSGLTWNNIQGGDSEDITTSFSEYGEYKIKLVVTDDYFTVDSQILTCNVIVAPVISSFSVSPSKVAVNGTINLNSTVTSETGNYSVKWSYKLSESSVWTDVVGGNVENTTLSLSTAGVYDVKLTATNEYGSVDDEDEVTVVSQPVISISLNETDITLGDSVTLTESITDSETGVSDVYVSYDEGSTWEYVAEMSGLTQVLTPEESGIVKYKVTYDNDLYELDSNIVSLNVYDVPVVSSVQITPSSGKIGYGNSITASVEVESELQTTNSWWYSQSGVKTTIPNSNVDEFEYTNLAVGEYTIGVDVTDSLGNTVTQTCSSTIYVYGAPSISISTSSHNVAVNTSITISQTVTVNETLGDEDYTSNIMVSYNGGEYVNCTSPYTVTQTGVYYFKGVVSDNYFSHIESSIETVNVGTIPAVTGSVDSDKVSTGSTIYLTGSVQSELTIEDYGWKYSTDGISYSNITTQSDYSASFLCENAGTYYFKFFAENALGIGESNVLTVNAYDARTITVTAMPSIVSTSMSITLTANVTTPSHASDIVSKGWELNHNGVWESMGIQDEVTSYIPQNYGDYLFRYKIVDEIGVTALSNTATVTVSDKPTVSIIVPENAIAGQSVLFTADVASLLELSSEKWYVDNVQVGTGESLVYTFNDLGEHVVKFTAENQLGETSAYSTVHVYNVPVISDFSVQSQSIGFEGYQTVSVETNVNSQGLLLQQNYEGMGWKNIGVPFTHAQGDVYTLTYKVQTDASHGGNVDVRVVATNPVGSVTSDVKSFTVEGKQPTEYSKAFANADGMAQTAIIIAALVMLVLIGIFIITVCTGTLEPMMALKAIGIIAIVFIVIVCLIVFIGSLSGASAPFL